MRTTDSGVPSRGALVGRILRGGQSLDEALVGVLADGARYNGFNLLCGDVNQGRWASNRAPRAVALAPGLHALSNAGLDTPWPKMSAWAGRGTLAIEPLQDALADRTLADEHELPSTGVTRERERMLSAPFIVSDTYGTRCSTVVTVAHDGTARFVEVAFDAQGNARGRVDKRFAI